jgi:peptide/nickel transport system ATP-binding protein
VIVEMGATVKVFGNPQHPYTQMLLASVPQLHRRWAEIEAGLLAAPTETGGERRPISHVDTIAAVELDALDSALVEFESDHFVRRSGALVREVAGAATREGTR